VKKSLVEAPRSCNFLSILSMRYFVFGVSFTKFPKVHDDICSQLLLILCVSMSDQSFPTSSYTPSGAVQATHNIPHFLVRPFGNISHAGFTTGNFYVNVNNPDMTKNYLQSIVVFPFTLLIIGLLVLLIVNVVSLCRYSFGNNKLMCCSASENESGLKSIRISYSIFIVLAFLVLSVIFLGNVWLNEGLIISINSLHDMSSLFGELSQIASFFNHTGVTIGGLSQNVNSVCCTSSNCSGVASSSVILQYQERVAHIGFFLQRAGKEIYLLSENIPTKINASANIIYDYGVVKKNIALYIFYAVVTVLLVMLYTAGSLVEGGKTFMQITLIISNLFLVVLLLLSTVFMVFVVK